MASFAILSVSLLRNRPAPNTHLARSPLLAMASHLSRSHLPPRRFVPNPHRRATQSPAVGRACSPPRGSFERPLVLSPVSDDERTRQPVETEVQRTREVQDEEKDVEIEEVEEEEEEREDGELESPEKEKRDGVNNPPASAGMPSSDEPVRPGVQPEARPSLVEPSTIDVTEFRSPHSSLIHRIGVIDGYNKCLHSTALRVLPQH